ncbi:hypothetical protein E4U21_005716 [Claviceps maximensis]|nr:hypothetical protein E4U21_005716 [Claviceps maximensis]
MDQAIDERVVFLYISGHNGKLYITEVFDLEVPELGNVLLSKSSDRFQRFFCGNGSSKRSDLWEYMCWQLVALSSPMHSPRSPDYNYFLGVVYLICLAMEFIALFGGVCDAGLDPIHSPTKRPALRPAAAHQPVQVEIKAGEMLASLHLLAQSAPAASRVLIL